MKTTKDSKIFSFSYWVGCGGTEEPFLFQGNKYLYVWNSKDKKHYYYSYYHDMYFADNDAVNCPWVK